MKATATERPMRRIAIWAVGSAVGVGVLALPDSGPRLVSLSEEHGPSLVDAVGIAVLIAAWVPMVSLLWTRRAALRSGGGVACGAIAAGGVVLLVVTIALDLGKWWIAGVVALVCAQLCAVAVVMKPRQP
jgi:hypothetical protein